MARIEDEPLVAAVLSTLPGTIIQTQREGLSVADPTESEQAALKAASDIGAAVLDTLNQTALDTITTEEWHEFVESTVTAFDDRLNELVDSNKQPAS